MKKIITLIVAILIANVVTAQVSNEQILEVIEQGGNVADLVWPQWIPGIDNDVIKVVVSNIALVILGLFHRKRTTKRWRKQGKLND